MSQPISGGSDEENSAVLTRMAPRT